jgi:hypothetical protein
VRGMYPWASGCLHLDFDDFGLGFDYASLELRPRLQRRTGYQMRQGIWQVSCVTPQ